jgi:hypothetical protein
VFVQICGKAHMRCSSTTSTEQLPLVALSMMVVGHARAVVLDLARLGLARTAPQIAGRCAMVGSNHSAEAAPVHARAVLAAITSLDGTSDLGGSGCTAAVEMVNGGSKRTLNASDRVGHAVVVVVDVALGVADPSTTAIRVAGVVGNARVQQLRLHSDLTVAVRRDREVGQVVGPRCDDDRNTCALNLCQQKIEEEDEWRTVAGVDGVGGRRSRHLRK